jgi:hypothetical protein
MATWSKEELRKIAEADDLHIAPFRDDRVTYGTPTWMTKEVTFEPVDGPINDRIGDAYRARYRGSPYLSPMSGARARPPRSRSCPVI